MFILVYMYHSCIICPWHHRELWSHISQCKSYGLTAYGVPDALIVSTDWFTLVAKQNVNLLSQSTVDINISYEDTCLYCVQCTLYIVTWTCVNRSVFRYCIANIFCFCHLKSHIHTYTHIRHIILLPVYM